MRRLCEQSHFNRGLARWIGFGQTIVYIDEDERLTGLWLVGEYLGRTYEEVKRCPPTWWPRRTELELRTLDRV